MNVWNNKGFGDFALHIGELYIETLTIGDNLIILSTPVYSWMI